MLGVLALLLLRNLIPPAEFLCSTAHDSEENDLASLTFCLFASLTKYPFEVGESPGPGGRVCCRRHLLSARAQKRHPSLAVRPQPQGSPSRGKEGPGLPAGLAGRGAERGGTLNSPGLSAKNADSGFSAAPRLASPDS